MAGMLLALASVSDIGGYYQLLPAADSFKGAYMLSVGNRFAPKSPISLVGSVDGSSFRTFNGTLDRATSQVVLGTRRGMLQDGRITWDMDEGTWQLQAAPAFQLVEAGAGAAFDGFYTDERYVQGSFAGTAMIAFDGPKRTGGFTMVGSDDGVAFWSVRGKFAAATGAVVVDASPWGGASRVNGTFAHGLLHLTSLDRTWTARARAAAAGGSEGVGYVAVAVAVLFFGTNFVPVKRFETGDGMFFQWVMCSAIFCWGLVLQLILFGLQPAGDCVPGVLGCRAALTNGRVDPYAVKFIPQAAAGGALWATGNTMAVPIINSIGLGMGMLIWGCTNMLMGWATGIAHLDRNTASAGLEWLNVLGVGLAVVALALYTCIKPAAPKGEQLLQEGSIDVSTGLASPTNAVVPAPRGGGIKRLVGILMAVVSGLFYGNNFTPPNLLLNTDEGPSNALDYVFSHFCGIYFASTVWMLVYCCYKRSTPVLYPRVILPGFLSGLMWAAAQTSWFVANASLSVAVAFPLITSGPGIVSSLWGVFVFKEITGRRNLALLSAAILLAVTGCTLIGVAKAL